MEERHDDILKFWQEGVLKPDSNVAFGEGGAGTFSDGKLNTGVKDKTGRKQVCFTEFCEFWCAGRDFIRRKATYRYGCFADGDYGI